MSVKETMKRKRDCLKYSMTTRNTDKIFLLGHDESQIIGAKLPSNGQILRILFYNMRKVKLNLRMSASLAIKETEVFWEKARIPTRKVQRSIEKLESLYQEWRGIHKNSKRRNELQIKREQTFLEKMDDLFDIAHANASEIINNEEDEIFLLNQRKKRRCGSMIGGNYVKGLSAKEKKLELHKSIQETRITKSQSAVQS